MRNADVLVSLSSREEDTMTLSSEMLRHSLHIFAAGLSGGFAANKMLTDG